MRFFTPLVAPTSPERWDFRALLGDWREDAMTFVRHDLPKIVLIFLVSFTLIRLLRLFAGRLTSLQVKKLPPGIRAQQVRTVSSVLTSVGVFVISFVAGLMVLGNLGLHLEPLLASAGVAGLAIGFGAQTL